MVILNTEPTRTKTGTICTLTEAKRQLQIEETDTADDDYISSLIDVALEDVEDHTKSDVLDTTSVLTYTLPYNTSIQSYYRINRAPMRTFSKLEVLIDENWEEVASTEYQVYTNFTYFDVQLTGSWPTGTITAVRFTYLSGYTDAKRPKKLKQATIVKVKDLFDTERGSHVTGTINTNIKTFERLLTKHVRTYWT